MNIAVFLSSRMGADTLYAAEAEALGRWIASEGNTLVFGASNSGLMARLSNAVHSGGGRIIGIQPHFFNRMEGITDGISELILTETLSERKERMAAVGDAFIAFPGGVGTLDEISDILAKAMIGHITKPIIFMNILGYYNPLQEYFSKMVEQGFGNRMKRLYFIDSVQELRERWEEICSS